MKNQFKYKILKDYSYGGPFTFKAIQFKNIFKILAWRNEQKNILRQKKDISKLAQVKYYLKEIINQEDKLEPKQLLFAIFDENEIIGYCGLVHISWLDKRAEISFLTTTSISKMPDKYEEIMAVALKFLINIGNFIYMNRLFTETYAFREKHISVLEKNGFELEGILHENICIDGKYHDSLMHWLKIQKGKSQ